MTSTLSYGLVWSSHVPPLHTTTYCKCYIQFSLSLTCQQKWDSWSMRRRSICLRQPNHHATNHLNDITNPDVATHQRYLLHFFCVRKRKYKIGTCDGIHCVTQFSRLDYFCPYLAPSVSWVELWMDWEEKLIGLVFAHFTSLWPNFLSEKHEFSFVMLIVVETGHTQF